MAPTKRRSRSISDDSVLPSTTNGNARQVFIAAPESSKFLSPVPGSALDTRNIDLSRAPKFHSMRNQASGLRRADWDVDDDEMMDEMDDEDDEASDEPSSSSLLDKVGKKKKYANKRNATSTGRRKIDIEYIDDKAKRHVSFTKRKQGLMKKAFELSTLTGTNCLVMVVSETGLVYHYATPGFEAIVEHPRGKELIAASLSGDLRPDDDDDKAVPKIKASNSDERHSGHDEMNGNAVASGSGTGNSSNATTRLPSRRISTPSITNDIPVYDHLNSSNSVGNLGSAELQRVRSQPELGVIDPALGEMLGMGKHLFMQSTGGPPSMVELVVQHLPPISMPFHSEGHSATLPPLNRTLPHAPVPTPYERANAEHIVAFEQFRNQTERDRARTYADSQMNPSITELNNTSSQPESNHPPPLPESSNYGAAHLREAAKGWKGFLPIPVPVRRASANLEDDQAMIDDSNALLANLNPSSTKRAFTQEEANQVVETARETQTIASFIAAQIAANRAAESSASSNLSIDSAGAETTLVALAQWCEETGIMKPEHLEIGTQSYLTHTCLSSSHVTATDIKAHLSHFFEFLHDHNLISATLYEKLADYRSTPREALAAQAFRSWVNQMCETYSSTQLGIMTSVSGSFEVYRVRETYALLRGKEMQGDRDINQAYSPFKVKLPKDVTSSLRIEDSFTLILHRVEGGTKKKSYWIPTWLGSFDPSSDPEGSESDIDPEIYRDELKALLASSPNGREEEDKIKSNRSVIGSLTRAKELLEEGELDD